MRKSYKIISLKKLVLNVFREIFLAWPIVRCRRRDHDLEDHNRRDPQTKPNQTKVRAQVFLPLNKQTSLHTDLAACRDGGWSRSLRARRRVDRKHFELTRGVPPSTSSSSIVFSRCCSYVLAKRGESPSFPILLSFVRWMVVGWLRMGCGNIVSQKGNLLLALLLPGILLAGVTECWDRSISASRIGWS